ncbi:MAG: hypothetical protein ABI691_25395 [Ginsengibacter sp.]
MSSVTGNKVQENGYKQLSFFHSANHLPIGELEGNKIAPEKAAEMLRKRGVDISVEQAAQILELLRKFAHIVVSQHLESQRQNVMRKAD